MNQGFGADLSAWFGRAEDGIAGGISELLAPAMLIQLALIAAALLIAAILGGRLEAWLEPRIRQIRHRPQLLRFLALVLRRTKWIVAAALLAAALVLLRAAALPGGGAIVGAALALVAAWVTISVLSRLIRNRTTRRLVAAAAWLIVALRITGLSEEVVALLDTPAVRIGSMRISAWLVIQALLLIGILFWAATAIGNLAERQIARSEDLTPTLRVLIGKLIKVALFVMAGAAALAILGIDFAALSFLAGALGLGIGFGLQKVVSNFVSGMIILLDKSIKPGDTIAVGETFGWVRSLRARYVEVITRDGREYLIPNEDFITQRVENWSFNDSNVRIDVKFGVSYDSDPHEVRSIAVEAAKSVERVMKAPQPVCHLTALGDSSVDFILRFWIADPQNGITNVRGAVLLACWDALKAAAISIPFPQRQIIVTEPITVRLDSAAPHHAP